MPPESSIHTTAAPGSAAQRRRGPAGAPLEALLVTATVVAAFLLRVVPSWDQVFAGGEVWFLENDPWYHVRVAEVWIESFPRRPLVDPYLQHPGGQGVPVPPFLDLLLAAPPALLGLSEHAARVWMALVPPLLGAAGVALLWGLARGVFERRAALLAAGLLAVEPGGYLVRSLLGFADHHALEAVLSIAVVWGVAATARAAGRRRLLGAAVTGLALGCYLLGWGGGALLVAILAAWAGLQSLLEGPVERHGGLAPVLVPVFVCAGATLALGLGRTPRWQIQTLALAGAAAGVLALDAVRTAAHRRGIGRARFTAEVLVGAAAVALVAGVALAAAAPGVANDLRFHVLRFLPSGPALTVGEVRPLLLLGDQVSWLPVWLHFRTTFFLGLAGLGWTAWRWWRTRDRAAGLAVVWGAAMLVATLGQVRFGYYLGPALALFAAPVCGAILDLSGVAAGSGASRASRMFYRGVAASVVVLLAFAPGAASSLASAAQDRTPPARWRQAMEWLRRETPEPFGDAAVFRRAWRELEGPSAPPRSSYGVLSWWDYGYWILHLGRRVPISNPTQHGAREAAAVLLETDPEETLRRLDQLGARYVVTDAGFAIVPGGGGAVSIGRFDAMCQWAEVDAERFYESVLLPDGRGVVRESLLFRPDYYRTAVARLAVLGLDEVVPQGRVLVAELERRGDAGPAVVMSGKWFDDWQQAEAAIRSGEARGSLFGTDPLRSPVPLPAMGGIARVAAFATVQVYERRPR